MGCYGFAGERKEFSFRSISAVCRVRHTAVCLVSYHVIRQDTKNNVLVCIYLYQVHDTVNSEVVALTAVVVNARLSILYQVSSCTTTKKYCCTEEKSAPKLCYHQSSLRNYTRQLQVGPRWTSVSRSFTPCLGYCSKNC